MPVFSSCYKPMLRADILENGKVMTNMVMLSVTSYTQLINANIFKCDLIGVRCVTLDFVSVNVTAVTMKT